MDEQSLQRLEFFRVTAAIARHAQTPGGAAALRAQRPFEDVGARTREIRLLDEAIRRQNEPGEWCFTGRDELQILLQEAHEEGATGLDGSALRVVLGWLEGAEATRRAWNGDEPRARFPGLAELAAALPPLGPLRVRLDEALEPDGRIADRASPALRRARGEWARGERDLEEKLQRWVRPYGDRSYVTRRGERFVALVPAAGFPRRRAIVHDVSGSGQSLFVEPLEACEANNRLIELRARVADEERRVLAELSDRVRESRDRLRTLEATLTHFDSLRARARWAQELGAVALEPQGSTLRLKSGRHPLLAMGEWRERLVPLDLTLGPEKRVLFVSGPNMGGKTVLLKTVGLAFALTHAGFPVLVDEGSLIPEIEMILVDVGDEQSLDQGLSTFAAHLRSLALMAERAGPRTLLLCDELGAGTDPDEGAALGRALIERFAARGAWAIVTSHLGSLKRVAGQVHGVENGSLDFDLETLSPRFRFLPGIPGASHALAMAGRLGFDWEVIERAQAMTSEEARSLERLIAELHATHLRLEAEEVALRAAQDRSLQAETAHREATESARRTFEDLKAKLTRESQVLLSHARELWQAVQIEARRSERSRTATTRMRQQIEAIEQEGQALEEAVDRARVRLGGDEDAKSIAPETLEPGARVRVVDLDVEAEVVEGPDAEGRVLLRRGQWSIQSHVSRLARAVVPSRRPGREVGSTTPAEPGLRRGNPVLWELPEEAPPVSVDVRGMDVEEALRALDLGIDRGVLGGLMELRIVHGVGRGVLKSVVERHLRDHPQVASLRMGELHEGGRGVTVARLK